jgi:hypothetical protein
MQRNVERNPREFGLQQKVHCRGTHTGASEVINSKENFMLKTPEVNGLVDLLGKRISLSPLRNMHQNWPNG